MSDQPDNTAQSPGEEQGASPAGGDEAEDERLEIEAAKKRKILDYHGFWNRAEYELARRKPAKHIPVEEYLAGRKK